VDGTGPIALRNAHAILVGGEQPHQALPANRVITLVFFSYMSGVDVPVQAVDLHDHLIDIRYRFVTYIERNLSMQLALIPLGKLSAGQYEVKVTQLPAGLGKNKHDYKVMEPPKYIKEAVPLVAQPFSFRVSKTNE
jgi:hypothetical protein